MSNLTWVDYTRRNDPAQPYFVARLATRLAGGQMPTLPGLERYPAVFCFWTKAPAYVAREYRDLIAQLRDHGTLVLAQVTLNSYLQAEPGVTADLADLEPLVTLLGAPAVRLRFDPLILGYTTPRHFEHCLSSAVQYGIQRITVNFFNPYPRARDRLGVAGVRVDTPTPERQVATLRAMVATAAEYGVTIAGCAEIYAAGLEAQVPGLVRAGCADPEWATQLRPELRGRFKPHPSRTGCLCVYSADWGEYENQGAPACPHRCLYCYARQ